MTDVVLMFEVHQPYRLDKRFREKLAKKAQEKGKLTSEDLEEAYFDHGLNKIVMERAAKRCYLPANKAVLEAIDRFKGGAREFKVSYSISGVFIEQAKRWAPEVIDSFRDLVGTGRVEILDQTYYHSLACVVSDDELVEQVLEHRALMKDLFGVEPTAAENTEFIYNNRIAGIFDKLGYKVIFTEGAERILAWRSPNYVYKAKDSGIRVLLRNYRLSDDIGFRYAARWWEEYPLTPDKYAAWLAHTPGDVINLCIDYETFGEHFPPETGIIEFLRELPEAVLRRENLSFATPTEAAYKYEPRGELDVPEHLTVSWADLERDLSAWLMNEMQYKAFDLVKRNEERVKKLGDPGYLRLWRLLMISDHFYYMSTKGAGPGDVHSYFSPYGTALDAYSTFIGIYSDFESRIIEAEQRSSSEGLR